MPAGPSQQHVAVEENGDVLIAMILTPRLVEDEDLKAFGEQLHALVDRYGASKLVVNFSRVRYFSSMALSKLFSLKRKLDAAGGQLRLCSIPADLAEIFKLVKTHPFKLCTDEDAAIASF
jgi:anti-anti-sigma factor